jgi:hypothetical protein
MRHLSVTLVCENADHEEQARSVVAEANEVLVQEVGIVLDIKASVRGRVSSWKPLAALHELKETIPAPETDLVVCFVRDPPSRKAAKQLLSVVTMQEFLAVIDDTWRRYIVLWHWHPAVLRHEVYHAFIPTNGHSGCGLMSSISAARFFPFTPPVILKQYLCEEDRDVVLRYKWRKFDEEPFAPRGGAEDMR